MKKHPKAYGSMIDVRQVLIGPPVQLFGYLAYLIFPPPDQTRIPYKSSIRTIRPNTLSDFIVKIAYSLLFSVKTNILKFNRLSTFAALIFLTSIISFNVNYINFVNNINNDDCLICDTGYDSIDDVSNLSIYDVYQVPSNDLIIVIVPTKNVFIKPYYLTFKIPTRAPPA
jgi:hypothetical protein